MPDENAPTDNQPGNVPLYAANEKIKQPSVDKAMILAQFLGVKVRFASGQHFNLFGG